MDFLKEILIIFLSLTAAHIASLKLKIHPIIGFIASGVLFGPQLLNIYHGEFLHTLSEIGIIFLMFSIGVHIDIKELGKLKKYVLGLGVLQVVLTTLLFIGFFDIVYYFIANESSLYKFGLLGGALALSSSAIILEKLIETNLTKTSLGKAKIGILIFQDLIAPLFLIFIPILGAVNTTGQIEFSGILISLLKTIGILIGVVFSILYILKPFFEKLLEYLYKSERQGFRKLGWVLIALSPALFADSLGLSAGIGALILGLSINETNFKKQAIKQTEGWKEVLLGIFFLYIGTLIDFKIIADNFLMIITLTIGIKAIKVFGTFLSCRLLKIETKESLLIGLNLSQVSEFSFLILAALLSYNFLNQVEYQLFSTIIILSMIFSIVITNVSFPIYQLFIDKKASKSEVK